jgi:hypothetical protein
MTKVALRGGDGEKLFRGRGTFSAVSAFTIWTVRGLRPGDQNIDRDDEQFR